MDSFIYKITGQRGSWFIEHSGGRFGPYKTKKEAALVARMAAAEGRKLGIEIAVIELPNVSAEIKKTGTRNRNR